jgi:hypothetical protein
MKQQTRNLYVLLTVGLAALVVALIVWLNNRRPDCAFSGWKKSVGVDLEVAVADLNVVKSKVGISDDVARDFDQLLKDYAAKFDTACEDVSAGRMTKAEYTCRRGNMDRALDSIRTFVQAVETAKTVADASTQKQIILGVFQDLRAASNKNYKTGCTSAMNVSPQQLTFTKGVPERSFRVSNYGNNEITFTVSGLPESFSAMPTVEKLASGAFSTVVIFRTVVPPKGDQIVRFHILDNLLDDQEIELTWDRETATLYQDWTLQLVSAPENNFIDAAYRVTSASVPKDIPQPSQKVLNGIFAAGVLLKAGRPNDSTVAFESAIRNYKYATNTDDINRLLSPRLAETYSFEREASHPAREPDKPN